jgi:hypothetical protein
MRCLSSVRLGYAMIGGAIAITLLNPSVATAQLPACLPPSATEYLLLAVIPNADAQARVMAIVPASSPSTTCNYLGETVVRVGGFASQDSANAWANYLAQQAQVSAFVATPSTSGQPTGLTPLPPSTAPSTLPPNTLPPSTLPNPTVPNSTVPSSPIGSAAPSIIPGTVNNAIVPQPYDPKPLGNGYAVLVNYYDRPELATQVRQTSGQPVNLVAYGQKPYLLATFTSDQSAANVLLQTLTDKGMWAMVVDGRRVILLKSNVGQ